MKIKVGDYDVLESGTIVSNENEPIDFFLAEDIGYIIRIVFDTKPELNEPTFIAEAFDRVGAKITFSNFDNQIGIGNISPLKIGTLNNRNLSLNYRVYSLEKGGKTFHYTWLLEKEVNNV